MIPWIITRSCINNNMDFVLKQFTAQAILHFLQYLYTHIDSGNIVFSLLLDFRKAFDCVNHEILLSKLNTCCVRGIALDWFRPYLTNREQYVSTYKQCAWTQTLDLFNVVFGTDLFWALFYFQFS